MKNVFISDFLTSPSSRRRYTRIFISSKDTKFSLRSMASIAVSQTKNSQRKAFYYSHSVLEDRHLYGRCVPGYKVKQHHGCTSATGRAAASSPQRGHPQVEGIRRRGGGGLSRRPSPLPFHSPGRGAGL